MQNLCTLWYIDEVGKNKLPSEIFLLVWDLKNIILLSSYKSTSSEIGTNTFWKNYGKLFIQDSAFFN
jgi:hypothetical protein